jgi:peptidyl-prolyl cis-trans isomerase A (cyclophilin A)
MNEKEDPMNLSQKTAVALTAAAIAAAAGAADAWKNTPGVYAVFETDLGRIVCRLYPDKSPNTVANFVGLAEGTKEFTDPQTGAAAKRRYFDGLIFHRVIPDFMIQGGDPLGTGYGGPGYKFDDERPAGVNFEKPGVLAMANAGPNTNGSQFFITVAPTPDLPRYGHYVIFGQVVEGQSVADAISKVKRNANDRPLTPVAMKKVLIERVAGKK